MSKREGTYQLAGLLEGPVPPEGEAVLRDWAAQARKQGIPLTLGVDGSMFSFIPETEDSRVWTQRSPLDDTLEACLGILMRQLPPESVRHCMCTLRSIEVLPGKERQSLYILGGADGEIQKEQREIPADTMPPPAPPDTRVLVRNGLIAFSAVVVVVLITLPFVPYGKWWTRAKQNVFRTPADELVAEAGPYAPFLGEGQVTWDRENNRYRIAFSPRPAHTAMVESEWRDRSLREIMALEDVMRGMVTVELLDETGKRIALRTVELHTEKGQTVCRITPVAKLKRVRFRL